MCSTTMLRYAHRGLHSNKHDENTMLSFQRAVETMDGFECDVRLSRDDMCVIVHDSSLERTHA